MRTHKQLLDEALKLLSMAKCPDCDGSGCYPRQISDSGDCEAVQCQWCDERQRLESEANSMEKPQFPPNIFITEQVDIF